LKEQLTYGTAFFAIEHTKNLDGEEVMHAIQLRKKGKAISLETCVKINEIKKVKNLFSQQKHVVLVINNQQVLFKKVTSNFTVKEQALAIAFPTIKVSDFYFQIYKSNSETFVAICRKEYVHKLIDTYKSIGISVVDFSLHSLSSVALSSYLDAEKLHTTNSVVSFDKHAITSIVQEKVEHQTYKINGLEVSNEYVLAFSGILAAFWTEKSTVSNFELLQEELSKEYRQKHFFSFGTKLMLGFIFTILLINFLIFNSAYKKMNQLNNELQIKASYKNTLVLLQNRVDEKVKFSKNILSLSSSRTTWVLNELGQSVPKTIQLSLLAYQPLAASIKKKKKIELNNKVLLLKGVSKDNDSFSNWISKLELNSWIEDVVVNSYGNVTDNNAEFEFLIRLK
jgi:Tfp pilus assembly protein PilN